MRRCIVTAMLLLLCPSIWLGLRANRFGVSTNLLDYARLGTLNVDASYAASRHWSVVAGVRYNPFTFNEGDPQKQFQYRQQSYFFGARWWLWHTWSGWWLSGKARYQEYNVGGLAGPETEEGDRIGAGLYVGYTHMLTPHLNMEFGLGFWGGKTWFTSYSCPVCGDMTDSGQKYFVHPDDLMISIVYVF